MKLKVNRLLSQGEYKVNFEVSDFSPEELSKMSSFGIPPIRLKLTTASGTTSRYVGLNQINKNLEARFPEEELAKQYEAEVKAQISRALEGLRQRKDEFSSSEEVDI
jgi:hypothetical protein